MRKVLTVTRTIEVGHQNGHLVTARPGDTITVESKGDDFLFIRKVNGQPLYSTWKRASYVLAHCKEDSLTPSI